jgi:hypothetical protein
MYDVGLPCTMYDVGRTMWDVPMCDVPMWDVRCENNLGYADVLGRECWLTCLTANYPPHTAHCLLPFVTFIRTILYIIKGQTILLNNIILLLCNGSFSCF